MAEMRHRTTFALDRDSILRLRRLAARWQVSQAEVVRRALRQVEAAEETSVPEDPLQALRAVQQADDGLTREEADAWLAEVEAGREDWR